MNNFIRTLQHNKYYIVCLIVVTLISYLNSFSNSFVWDDYPLVVNNSHVHSFAISKLITNNIYDNSSGIAGFYYRPLTMIMYSFIYVFAGSKPLLFHLVQVLLHTSSALLIFLLFKKRIPAILSCFLALIFVVHPIHIEGVGYVSGLGDTLYVFFGLFGISLLEQKRSSSIYISFLFFLLAIFSKESGILFIILAVAHTLLYSKTKLLQAITLAFGSLLGYFLIRNILTDAPLLMTSKFHPIMNLTFTERLITMPKVVFYYLSTYFYPSQLAIGQIWIVTKIDLVNFYLPLLYDILFFVLLIGGAFVVYKKKKVYFRDYAFFFIWFGLGLGMHLHLIPLDLTVSDRYFYMPSIGLLGLIGTALTSVLGNYRIPKGVVVSATFIIVILLMRTYTRLNDWKDPITLYEHDTNISNNYLLINNLGTEYFKKGDSKHAEFHYNRSIQLFPNEFNITNLGTVKAFNNQTAEAELLFRKALEYGENPSAYDNLIVVLLKQKKWKEAYEVSGTVLEKNQNNPKILMFAAVSAYQLGNKEIAKALMERSYLLYPNQNSLYFLTTMINGQPLNITF